MYLRATMTVCCAVTVDQYNGDRVKRASHKARFYRPLYLDAAQPS